MAFVELPPLVALAILTALILTLLAYKATLGAVVDWMIGEFHKASLGVGIGPAVHPLRFLVGPLQAFQNLVYHTLGNLIEADKAVWNKFVSWNAYAWSEVSGAIADIGHGAEQALHKLRQATIPALIAATTGPLSLILYPLVKQVAQLAAKLAHQGSHVTKIVTHELTPAVTSVTKVTKIIYRTAPAAVAKAVAVPIPRIGQLEREASAAEKWIKTNAKKLTVGGIVGLTVAAIGRLGLGWTRCSNVSRVGKALCGMERGILDDLLAGALIVASSISVVELAHECQAFTGTVDEGLRLFVRELS